MVEPPEFEHFPFLNDSALAKVMSQSLCLVEIYEFSLIRQDNFQISG